MIQWIQETLTRIADFFGTLWDFIISLIRDIVYIIELLATAVSNMGSYFVWLPAAVTTLLFMAIGVIVVYKILGRD